MARRGREGGEEEGEPEATSQKEEEKKNSRDSLVNQTLHHVNHRYRNGSPDQKERGLLRPLVVGGHQQEAAAGAHELRRGEKQLQQTKRQSAFQLLWREPGKSLSSTYLCVPHPPDAIVDVVEGHVEPVHVWVNSERGSEEHDEVN